LREKEDAVLSVVEFTAIVTLNKANRQSKVCENIIAKIKKEAMNIRFSTKRKSPNVMRVIIHNHKIIFITRNTRNWGGLEITME